MTYILNFCLTVTCSHLLRQPLGSHLSLKQVKFNTCTLISLCKSCKISSSLARTSLGFFHDLSARSSGENRNFFAEQHCRNRGFLQSCVRRNYDILRTEVAVTCSQLAATCSHLLGQPLASGCKRQQNGNSKCAPPASSMGSIQQIVLSINNGPHDWRVSHS